MKGSVETLAITFGLALMPSLKRGVEAVTGFVNSLIPLAEEWGPVVGEAIANVASAIADALPSALEAARGALEPLGAIISSTIVPAFGAFLGIVQTVGAFLAEHLEIVAGFAAAFAVFATIALAVTAILAVGGALAFLLSPLGLVLAAIGLLTAAWVGNWFDIQGKTQAALDVIVPAIESALAAIEACWNEHGDTIMTVALAAWEYIVTGIKSAVAAITGVIKAIGQAWNGDWAGAWQTLTKTAAAIWEGWGTQLDAALTILEALFGPIWEAIKATVQSALDAITTSIFDAWNGITTTIQGALDGIGATITGAWEGFVATITGIGAPIREAALAVWHLLLDGVRADLELIATHLVERGRAWVESIVTTGRAILKSIVSAGAEWVTAITTAGAEMWEALTTKLAEIVTAVTTWADSTFLSPLRGLTGTATSAMTDVDEGMETALSGSFARILADERTWIGSFVSAVRSVVGQVTSAAQDVGRAISQGIANGISAAAGAIRSAAYRAAREALDAAKRALGIDSPSKVFKTEVSVQVGRGLIEGIASMQRASAAAMQALVTPPATLAPARVAPSPSALATVGAGGGGAPVYNVSLSFTGSPLVTEDQIVTMVVRAIDQAQRSGRTRVRVV